jgi:class 3 adenylate cyclase
MAEPLDFVQRYASSVGLDVRARTLLVEGTSDVDLFSRAARFERDATGVELLGADFTIVAAGLGDRGGTAGVIRELVCLRGLARACLLPNGRPRYRFAGLFDNDRAGRQAISQLRAIDSSILEFKDVFRLWPVMPPTSNLDTKGMQRLFEHANELYSGLDWELEDMIPDGFVDAFAEEFPDAVRRNDERHGRTHREFTADGKSRLHQFIRVYAMRYDLRNVIGIIRVLRQYMGLT